MGGVTTVVDVVVVGGRVVVVVVTGAAVVVAVGAAVWLVVGAIVVVVPFTVEVVLGTPVVVGPDVVLVGRRGSGLDQLSTAASQDHEDDRAHPADNRLRLVNPHERGVTSNPDGVTTTSEAMGQVHKGFGCEREDAMAPLLPSSAPLS